MHLQYEFSLVIYYYLNQSESVNVICHLKSFFMLKKQTFTHGMGNTVVIVSNFYAPIRSPHVLTLFKS